jgi:hypothetical protein
MGRSVVHGVLIELVGWLGWGSSEVVLWRFLITFSVRKGEKGKLVSIFVEVFLWCWDRQIFGFRIVTGNVEDGSGGFCYNGW